MRESERGGKKCPKTVCNFLVISCIWNKTNLLLVMLGLAHTNIRANMHSVSPATASKRAVYVSNSRLHMNQRDLGETLNMVLSRGAFWQTHWYVGAFTHLPDSHLKQQHPMFPSHFISCLIGHSNVTTVGTHKPTQIKLCAWQLRVRQKDMGRESWRQKQSARQRDWEKRWKAAREKAGGRK